jgi:hypothetical protein
MIESVIFQLKAGLIKSLTDTHWSGPMTDERLAYLEKVMRDCDDMLYSITKTPYDTTTQRN